MRCNFYLVAKESISVKKYIVLCKLEACHGVDLGHAYKTALSVKLFTRYIMKSQLQQFLHALSD